MSCLTGLKNVGKTGDCTPGYWTGLVIFDSPHSIDLDSAKEKVTFESLAKLEPPYNLMYVRFDDVELSENEPVTAELLGGRQIVIDEKKGMDKYKIVADTCAYNSIYANNKSGVKAYGYYTTSGGGLLGKLSDDKFSLETIEFYIATTAEKPKKDAPGFIVLNVQPQEDWLSKSYAVDIDFDFYSLDVLRNSYISNVTGDANTSIVFDMYYCGGIPCTDADPSKFTVKDSTGAIVTMSPTSVSGNTYTLESSTLPADDYTISYINTTNDDYIYLEPTKITVY